MTEDQDREQGATVIVVQQVIFGDEEVTFTFGTAADIRDVAGQPVLRSSQLTVVRGHPSYPEVGELYEAAQDCVRDILDDFSEAAPWQPQLPFQDQDQDEDEGGMGE